MEGSENKRPSEKGLKSKKTLGRFNSFSSEKIPSSLRSQKPLTENLNPIAEEVNLTDQFFSRKPFRGFDCDQVIVPKTKQRQISKIPFKVLDAPALKDDYYLNLVDWSE